MDSLDELLHAIRRCELCRAHLPLGPRPVIQATREAPILLVGQAPGRKVHASGKPFDDASGERLRSWLGVDREQFYNARLFSIAPMGFCYPGTGSQGDLPPRPECAATWRQPLMAELTNRKMTLLIGQYAINWHLPGSYKTVTAAVADYQRLWPEVLALPHPSPRNNRWLKRNPWFESEIVPQLRARVKHLLASTSGV
ncbi:uracil-DNA glycosylase family protein [Aliidiomarina soli]|uniref:IclR family transcriptional regulator n=1 Tax=Aliidiomarina soli TaxID=1928574 RepID=A0A432WHQ3_9GAMM|nr:uracil-DNA glycosylase family protein [Aliidiomarina soli]RUO33247.1 IclR family transcriptional regulator [Aliidiomarina soli]